MRGMEGPLEVLIAGVIIGGVFGGCAGYRLAGGSSDNSPMSSYDDACEQEYVNANDGNAETEVETAILEQPDCQAYIATMKAERQQEQQETVGAAP